MRGCKMSFRGLASSLKITTDEKLTIAEMTDRLNKGNVTYKPPSYSPTGYIQGDAPGNTYGGEYHVVDDENVFQFRDYCYYGTPIQKVRAFTSVLKRVGISAFEGCTKLKQVTFLSNDDYVLEEVDDRAFFGAGSDISVGYINLLANAVQSRVLERIGVSAFENTGNSNAGYYSLWVGPVSGNGAPIRIEARAFANSFLSDLYLRRNVEYIAPDALLGCTALKDVHISFSQSSSAATNYPWGADTSITTFHWEEQ